jgi:hypothetical protein
MERHVQGPPATFLGRETRSVVSIPRTGVISVPFSPCAPGESRLSTQGLDKNCSVFKACFFIYCFNLPNFPSLPESLNSHIQKLYNYGQSKEGSS